VGVDGELVFFLAGFGADAVPYEQALELQRELHGLRVAGDIPDTCLLLEHEPVYTAGRRTEPADRPVGDAGAPVLDVDRGGRITWHGPGQLVGACAEFGLTASRVDGRSGAWITPGQGGGPDRKVAAIGIRVARGTTMHGFALNCDNDLSWFGRIVPCGISDASVTSITTELGREVTVSDAIGPVQRQLAAALGASTTRQVGSVAELRAIPVS
jgi:lipoyl(octanoyl) transferase